MKSFKIIAVLFNVLAALAIGFGVETATVTAGFEMPYVAEAVSLTVFTLGLIPREQLGGILSMAIQQEVWIRDIQETLFEGSEFVNMSTNHDAFVVDAFVNLPQGGANPAIVKNRSSFPATITERTDTILQYPVDEFTTDPIRVRDFDDLQTSYAKRQSVIGQHVNTLGERIGTEVANLWGPTGTDVLVIGTTGGDTSAGPAGSTGTRQKLLKEDIASAAKKLDLDNVPSSGRFMLMPVNMYYELFETDALIRKDFMDRTALPMGVIDRLFGFNIMVRPTVNIYDMVTPATPVKQAVGATITANHSFGILCWHQNFVAKAQGAIKVFLDEDKADHYGSVFSSMVPLGASKLRTDNKGIVAISQTI